MVNSIPFTEAQKEQFGGAMSHLSDMFVHGNKALDAKIQYSLQRGREMGRQSLSRKRQRKKYTGFGEREAIKFTFTNSHEKGFKDRKRKRMKIASAVKAKLQPGEAASDEKLLEIAAVALETELDQYISNHTAPPKSKGRIGYLVI